VPGRLPHVSEPETIGQGDATHAFGIASLRRQARPAGGAPIGSPLELRFRNAGPSPYSQACRSLKNPAYSAIRASAYTARLGSG
jgi:hypothetical protein